MLGRTDLLVIAEAYADYIDHCFGPEAGKIRGYDGHAEIEPALYRLYEDTGIDRYKRLADFLLRSAAGNHTFFGRTAEYECGEEPGI